MAWAPLVRNLLRWVAGLMFGIAGADMLKTNIDLENALVTAGSLALSAVVAWLYAKAKARGWAT